MEKILKSIVYHFHKTIAHIGVRMYFRGIERNGVETIPKKGPLIYAVNHQNAFIDAIIVGSITSLPTYYMTRSDVFKPPFDWFLDAFKMMPIYRIRDGYSSLQKNDDIFDTCTKHLSNKQGLLIFPEGNHGLHHYLRPLTKGMARIALQSQSKIEEPIMIIPTGLNYFDHFNSGRKLVINYGRPISVTDYMDRYNDHPQKGLRAITKDVSVAMQEMLIIPTKEDNYEEQKHIFSRSNEHLTSSELRLKINDTAFTKPHKTYPILGQVGRLFGILNFPVLLLGRWIINTKVSQKIFSSSIKIAMIILVFPTWFLLCFLVVGFTVSWPWAFLFFLIQIATLIIRQELVRLSR